MQEPSEPTDAAGNPATANPSTEGSAPSAERRRRRRPRKGKHRHRDLTPEEDNRLRQRRALLVIVPAILALLGAIVWIVGAWNIDQYQHKARLIVTGQVFLLLGGGVLSLLFLRQWSIKLMEAIHERRHPPMDTSLHRHRHHRGRRSDRRRHRSARPSAFHAE